MYGYACRELANLIAQEACLVMSVGSLSLSHHLLREVVELANKPQWLDALWEEQQRLMEEYGPELNRQVCDMHNLHACTLFTPRRLIT